MTLKEKSTEAIPCSSLFVKAHLVYLIASQAAWMLSAVVFAS